MIDQVEILDGSGHRSIGWDPNNAEEVAWAKEEVKRLTAEGYQFFAVVPPGTGGGGPNSDPVNVGHGYLIVERLRPAEAPGSVLEPQETVTAPQEATGTAGAAKRARKAVATRPLRGG